MIHFIKKPTYTPTRQERIHDREQTAQDILYMKAYAIFFLIFFLTMALGIKWIRSFAEEPAIVEEKQAVVQQITHKEIVGPKYTIRVGLEGARKLIPTITGKTTEDRAKELLSYSKLGETLPVWQKMGQKHAIDYTLPICIAWADSHLGEAALTKNNLGNVGNNDRGDKVHFATIEKGIEAIFLTLNNKYLGEYKELGYLSGEGRTRMKKNGCV